jgi:hypothetical protein
MASLGLASLLAARLALVAGASLAPATSTHPFETQEIRGDRHGK